MAAQGKNNDQAANGQQKVDYGCRGRKPCKIDLRYRGGKRPLAGSRKILKRGGRRYDWIIIMR